VDFKTEQFHMPGGNTFDLAYSSVTFTPAAEGTSYEGTSYWASRERITRLPTDPSGGMHLEGLSDDNCAWIRFTDQTRVRLFNQSYDNFFVGSNGYITFTQGDYDYSESLNEHFNIPRIAGLYTNLNAANTGRISIKELSKRVAITWQGVEEVGSSALNTFQIEMFHNGKIRLSWLGIGSRSNIVGLSNGKGLKPNFEETDFSERYKIP
jgi:hypothetical protein